MKTFLFFILWIASAVGLLCGWVLPLITIEKFFVFGNEVSIISALLTLLEENYFLILFLVFLVSVVMPVLKLSLLLWCRLSHRPKAQKILHHLGKWSQTDVFIVAFMVVALKLRGMVSVSVEVGFYSFVASALISYALGFWLERHWQRAAATQ